MEVREISNDPDALALAWLWWRRQPGAEDDLELSDRFGPDWWHYLFTFDAPCVCISINERRPRGYELHIAAARKSASQTRAAAAFVCERLLRLPDARVAAWVQARNRASRILTAHFLRLDGGEAIRNGEPWVRYSATADEWRERYGIWKGRNPEASV